MHDAHPAARCEQVLYNTALLAQYNDCLIHVGGVELCHLWFSPRQPRQPGHAAGEDMRRMQALCSARSCSAQAMCLF